MKTVILLIAIFISLLMVAKTKQPKYQRICLYLLHVGTMIFYTSGWWVISLNIIFYSFYLSFVGLFDTTSNRVTYEIQIISILMFFVGIVSLIFKSIMTSLGSIVVIGLALTLFVYFWRIGDIKVYFKSSLPLLFSGIAMAVRSFL